MVPPNSLALPFAHPHGSKIICGVRHGPVPAPSGAPKIIELLLVILFPKRACCCVLTVRWLEIAQLSTGLQGTAVKPLHEKQYPARLGCTSRDCDPWKVRGKALAGPTSLS